MVFLTIHFSLVIGDFINSYSSTKFIYREQKDFKDGAKLKMNLKINIQYTKTQRFYKITIFTNNNFLVNCSFIMNLILLIYKIINYKIICGNRRCLVSNTSHENFLYLLFSIQQIWLWNFFSANYSPLISVTNDIRFIWPFWFKKNTSNLKNPFKFKNLWLITKKI